MGAIREFAEGLRARYGLQRHFRLDGVISPRIDGGRKPLQQRLTPDELAAIELSTSELRTELCDFYSGRSGHKPATDDLYQCGAGIGGFLIDPYGRLHVCELSRTLGWDVLRHGFARGWYEAIPEVRKKKRKHDDGCGSCAAHGGCSNCVGMAELEGRLPEDGNLYFCSLTEARGQQMFGDAHARPNGLVRLRRPGEQPAIV
jgi:radical SAM protein with 4Fe4S-binding SPASM domain